MRTYSTGLMNTKGQPDHDEVMAWRFVDSYPDIGA